MGAISLTSQEYQEKDLGINIHANLYFHKDIGIFTREANKIVVMIARYYDNKKQQYNPVVLNPDVTTPGVCSPDLMAI